VPTGLLLKYVTALAVSLAACDRRTPQHAEMCILRRAFPRFLEGIQEDWPGDGHAITP